MTEIEEKIVLPSEERQKAVEYLSNVQAVRVNSFEPYRERTFTDLVDTTAENLDIEFSPTKNFQWVITSVSAWNATNTGTRTELSLVRGGVEHHLNIDVQADAHRSIDWSGQTIGIPGDRIRAKFVGGTAGDDIYLSVHGYTIEM